MAAVGWANRCWQTLRSVGRAYELGIVVVKDGLHILGRNVMVLLPRPLYLLSACLQNMLCYRLPLNLMLLNTLPLLVHLHMYQTYPPLQPVKTRHI